MTPSTYVPRLVYLDVQMRNGVAQVARAGMLALGLQKFISARILGQKKNQKDS